MSSPVLTYEEERCRVFDIEHQWSDRIAYSFLTSLPLGLLDIAIKANSLTKHVDVALLSLGLGKPRTDRQILSDSTSAAMLRQARLDVSHDRYARWEPWPAEVSYWFTVWSLIVYILLPVLWRWFIRLHLLMMSRLGLSLAGYAAAALVYWAIKGRHQ